MQTEKLVFEKAKIEFKIFSKFLANLINIIFSI